MHGFLKKILLLLLFYLILALFLKFSYKASLKPLPDLGLSKECEDTAEATRIITATRNNVSHIESLSAPSIEIRLKKLAATGSLFYEGDKIRLLVSSFLGKEMDIGSNNEIFWFWLKRLKPQALYYANHNEDLSVELKPVFNKEWILSCFVFSKLEVDKDDAYYNMGDYLLVRHSLKDSPNYMITVIDSSRMLVTSKHIRSPDGLILAYISYDLFDELHVPRKICVNWYEESIEMTWYIKEVSINKRIEDATWLLPNHLPRVKL